MRGGVGGRGGGRVIREVETREEGDGGYERGGRAEDRTGVSPFVGS